jgi:ubiquitin C-terminal hydrolase
MMEILNQYLTSGDAIVHCSVCKNDTLHKRILGLSAHPEILVIQAKLFLYENDISEKRNVVIEPDDLSIVAVGPSGRSSSQYMNYAVVAHIGGSIEHGHFLTIACGSGCSARNPSCGSPSGCWWLFDDHDVEGPMSKEDALELLSKKNVSFRFQLLPVMREKLLAN